MLFQPEAISQPVGGLLRQAQIAILTVTTDFVSSLDKTIFNTDSIHS